MTEKVFYSRYKPAPRFGLMFRGTSRTKQAFADECDINRIMARYNTIENYNAVVAIQSPVRVKPQFGDFTTVPDFVAAQNTLLRAQAMFDALPAVIRDRFANDPAKLLAFLEDPVNRDEAVKLGLCETATETSKSGVIHTATTPIVKADVGNSEVAIAT